MRARRLAVAGTLAALLTGCASTPRPHVEIGMSKVGLNRAFTNVDLPPLPPEVIVRIIPAPPGLASAPVPDLTPFEVRPDRPAPPKPTTVVARCPKAAADATVPGPAPFGFAAPPEPGRYNVHNVGTITLSAAGQTFRFPYPPATTVDISPSKVVDVPVVPGLPVTNPHTELDLTTTLMPGHTVVERLQYDGATLDLVSRTETDRGPTTSVTWTPPVEIFATGGPGITWQDLASDDGARHALGIQGSVDRKTVVDVCGSLVETVEASSTTTVVELSSGATSGTTAGARDVLRVATGFGALFAEREQHTTEVRTVEGIPATITTDVVSTLDSLTPVAVKR
jgi:hypothetical protein